MPRLLLLLALLFTTPTLAQTQNRPNRDAPRDAAAAPATPRLPAQPAQSTQTVELPAGPLRFTADVEFIRILDEAGAPEADINTTAYLAEAADPAQRPVTFVVNGGPGMASAWLQLGAVGPWRIDLRPSPSASAALIPNADTWLQFTDLVFLDPAGTGYSRFVNTGDETKKRLWSTNGDVDSLAQTIRRWLDRHGRGTSPKFLLGESYGGFRGPRIALRLAKSEGVGLSGIVLVSPLLDFGNRSGALDLLPFAVQLPSMNAAVRDAAGQAVSRADLAPVEDFAAGAFLADILKGPGDAAALDRLVPRVAEFTGLPDALVRQRRGLVSTQVFVHEHDRATHRLDSAYDTTIANPDPFPENLYGNASDPATDAFSAPTTEAAMAVYDRLHWHPEGQTYALFNPTAFRRWDGGNALYRPQSLGSLREILALDPDFHALVVHGLFDLVTPYFGSALLLNQIAPTAGADRVQLLTLPGGHMFYSRPPSRAALHDAAAKLITPKNQ